MISTRGKYLGGLKKWTPKIRLLKCSGECSAIFWIDSPEVFVTRTALSLTYGAILANNCFLMSRFSMTDSIIKSH